MARKSLRSLREALCRSVVAGSWLVVIAMIKGLLGGLMWWVVVSATGASADLECCRY